MEARIATPLPGWRFGLAWVLATIAGAVVFVILVTPLDLGVMAVLARLGLSAESSAAPGLSSTFVGALINALSSALMGAAFGIGQWLVLRRVLRGVGGWVLATLIGYPLVFASQRLIPWGNTPVLGGALMFLSFGVVLGVLQWLVLNGRVPRAEMWILISIAGWLLAFLLIGAVEVSGLYVEPFDMLAALLVPTMVSGAGMVWLLRREPPQVQWAGV